MSKVLPVGDLVEIAASVAWTRTRLCGQYAFPPLSEVYRPSSQVWKKCSDGQMDARIYHVSAPDLLPRMMAEQCLEL